MLRGSDPKLSSCSHQLTCYIFPGLIQVLVASIHAVSWTHSWLPCLWTSFKQRRTSYPDTCSTCLILLILETHHIHHMPPPPSETPDTTLNWTSPSHALGLLAEGSWSG